MLSVRVPKDNDIKLPLFQLELIQLKSKFSKKVVEKKESIKVEEEEK